MLTTEQIEDHIEFLEDTLMPDLEKSGHVCTVCDFELCIDIIRQLQEEIRCSR